MLSIIIVSWNTARLLENCLTSILANTPNSPFEIWVVDNASTDDSLRMVRERFPRVHLIENRKNVGFARANNQALQQCSGKYLLLLNPDTLVSPAALQALIEFMDYFIYSEEIDLCYRVQRAGWRIYWVPQAEIVHFGGQSTQQVPTEMFLNLYHSKIKYFRKHYGWPGGQIYKLILRVAALSRIVLAPFILFEHSSRRQKHLTLVDRYWRLVRALPRM